MCGAPLSLPESFLPSSSAVPATAPKQGLEVWPVKAKSWALISKSAHSTWNSVTPKGQGLLGLKRRLSHCLPELIDFYPSRALFLQYSASLS